MEERLSTLYELQVIDNQLDELEELRGDLPLAVNDLTGQINTYKNQIESKNTEKKKSLDKRSSNEDEIERLKENLKKFKAQLYQVRNNKEYDALTKEIDHSEETVTKLESENKAIEELVEKLKIEIKDIEPQLEVLNGELKEKENELKQIINIHFSREGFN